MDRTPSKPRAALWMAGWLSLMLTVAIAGREAAREVNVFQLMQMRCVLGFFTSAVVTACLNPASEA